MPEFRNRLDATIAFAPMSRATIDKLVVIFFKQKTAYEIGLGIPAEPLFRSWKALNLRKALLMASSVRLKPLNCSRLPCVYAQETLTFLLTQKKTCVKNYVQKE